MYKRPFPIDITRHQLSPYQEQQLELDIQRNDGVVRTYATTVEGKRIIFVTLTDEYAGNNQFTIARRHELCEEIYKKAHSRAGRLKQEKAVLRGMVGHGKKH